MTTLTQLDARDTEILAQRIYAFEQVTGPRVGDYVRFADDVTRRISYIWRDEHDQAFNVQTSDGGSFYLGNGVDAEIPFRLYRCSEVAPR
jgi:hypothetical protein